MIMIFVFILVIGFIWLVLVLIVLLLKSDMFGWVRLKWKFEFIRMFVELVSDLGIFGICFVRFLNRESWCVFMGCVGLDL